MTRSKSIIISDLAKTLKRSEENQIYFFSKTERFDLFIPLKREGFFSASSISEPIKTGEGELLTRWAPESYFEKIGKHIVNTKGADQNLTLEFLSTLRSLSPKRNFLLASTLFKCFCTIPSNLLVTNDINLMFEWLRESGGSSSIVEDTLLKGLASFIESIEDNAHDRELLSLFAKQAFEPSEPKDSGPSNLRFIPRHDHRHLLAKHFNISKLASSRPWIIDTFLDALESLLISELKIDDRDARSVIWRPAVEDHKQNEYRDTAMSLLIGIIFNMASELLSTGREVSKLGAWESSPLWGFRRIYFALAAKYPTKIEPEIAAKRFIDIGPSSFFRHEAFSFLTAQFDSVSEETQNNIVEAINKKIDEDLDESDPRVLAWEKLRWMSAIKNSSNKTAENFYQTLIAITEHEPEHPDFSSYSSEVVWVGRKSPYTPAEISQMTIEHLVQELQTFSLTDDFRGPTIEGFGNALEQHITENPIRIIEIGPYLADLRQDYISSILDGAIKALAAKKHVPISDIIAAMEKWIAKAEVISNLKENKRDTWTVSSFARLAEEGTKDDAVVWEKDVNIKLREILKKMLAVTPEREDFDVNSDAFTRAINDAKGRIYEALISLTLLQARTASDEAGRQEPWGELRTVFDAGLKNDTELSLRALFGAYYRQMQYLGGDWLFDNLPLIIKRDKSINQWLSFMDGFSYVAHFDKKIYIELRDNGDLLKYLRFGIEIDSSRRDRLQNRVVELAVIAFLLDVEQIEEGILADILSKDDINEWHALIWALPSVLGKDPPPDFMSRAKFLINRIFDIAESRGNNGNAKYFAGLWRVLDYFTDPDDPIVERILLRSSKAAEGGWDFFGDLEYLHRYRNTHTSRVAYLFKKMIDSSGFVPSYPEDKIREISQALIDGGESEVISEICVRYANEAPNGGPIRDICNKL